MGGRAWRRATAASLLTLACNPQALAQWTIAPDISLRGRYTDNASLAAAPTRGDFITEVAPGIGISGRGPRLTANARYTGNAIFYSRNSSENRIANTLNAFATLEAVENFFFLDASGNIQQSFLSPFAARPADVTTISENRTETRTWGLSPYVLGQVGNAFSYELRNRNLWTSARSDALPDVHTRQWSARASSPVRLFGWALEFDDTSIRHEGGAAAIRPPQDSRLYRARLYFQPDVSLRLSASAGREENNFVLQQERSSRMYGVGATWAPTPRTSAELDWERRYFGSSRLARLTHRARLTAWSAAYSKNATSFQQELLRLPPGNTAALLDAIFAARIPDPVARRAAVEDFMRRNGTPQFLASSLAFFSEQVQLQERLEGSVMLIGTRNSVGLTLFRSQTTSLTDPGAAAVPDVFLLTGSEVRQHGFGVNASHRLTPFTSISASATRTFARDREPATASTRNDFLSLNLTHRLSPRTDTFAGFSFQHVEGSVATSNARSVFAGLTHRF